MNLRQLYLRNNACFIQGRAINIQGIMIHSTGANNPNLRRYVGPCDGEIGHNPHNNHWNHYHPEGRVMGPHPWVNNGNGRCRTCNGRQVMVSAFIGKLANGSIATVMCAPWDMRMWHSGGRANDTHISIEICEDDLTNRAYFDSVYQEAIELSAYLCRMFKLNPLADGVLIDHAEGHRRGIASNHGDVMHWFRRHGKNMDTFRNDVHTLLGHGGSTSNSNTTEPTPERSFPIDEDNLQAMVDMGIVSTPGFWRGVTTIQWLNELMQNVAAHGNCANNVHRKATTPDEAIEVLSSVGIIGSPGYWQGVVRNSGVAHIGGLLMNMANNICRANNN